MIRDHDYIYIYRHCITIYPSFPYPFMSYIYSLHCKLLYDLYLLFLEYWQWYMVLYFRLWLLIGQEYFILTTPLALLYLDLTWLLIVVFSLYMLFILSLYLELSQQLSIEYHMFWTDTILPQPVNHSTSSCHYIGHRVEQLWIRDLG